jgi:hypothetical protein
VCAHVSVSVERDQHVNQIVLLRNEVSDLMEKVRHMESEKSQLDQEISGLRDLIAIKKQEGEREQRRKERLENDVKDMKLQLEGKQKEIREKQGLLSYAVLCCGGGVGLCRSDTAADKHRSASRSWSSSSRTSGSRTSAYRRSLTCRARRR